MSDLDRYIGPEVDLELDAPLEQSKPAENLLVGLLGTLKRFWWILPVSLLLVGGGGAYAVWKLVLPEYTSVGAIRVRPIIVNVLGEKETGEISNYDMFINTQVNFMTQNEMLSAVTDRLAGEQLKSLSSGQGPRDLLREAILSSKLQIHPDPDTEFIKVSMTSVDGEDAQAIVNGFLQAYNSLYVVGEGKRVQSKYSNLTSFLQETIQKIKEKQDLIKDLQSQFGATDLTSHHDLAVGSVSTIQEQLYEYQFRKIALEMRLKVLEGSPAKSMSPSEKLRLKDAHINNDSELNRLMESLSRAEDALRSGGQLLKPDHPRYVQQKDYIDKLNNQIEDRRTVLESEFEDKLSLEVANTREIELEEVRLQIDEIDVLLATIQQMMAGAEDRTKDIGTIQIQIEDHHNALELHKAELAEVRRALRELELEDKSPARVSIGWLASEPDVIDKRPKMMVAAVGGSFGFGLALIFLLFKLDSRLRTPDDVIRCLDLPVIGTTSALNRVQPRALTERITDDFQAIRTNLGLMADEGIPPIIAVTSPGAREGKTTFAINLATTIARSGCRVLLIDGDFRKPDIGAALSLNGKTGGVQKVLFNTATLEEARTILPDSHLHVLASDPLNVSGTFEMLHRPETVQRLRGLIKHYDHIIIDTPPLLATPDALLWTRIADAAVLIGFSGQTSRNELKEAFTRLSKTRVRVLGTVLNNVAVSSSYYRYGYGYDRSSLKKRQKRQRYTSLLLPDESHAADYGEQST